MIMGINESSLIVIDLIVGLKGQVTDFEFVCDSPKGLYRANKKSYDKAVLNFKFKEQKEVARYRYILYVD